MNIILKPHFAAFYYAKKLTFKVICYFFGIFKQNILTRSKFSYIITIPFRRRIKL